MVRYISIVSFLLLMTASCADRGALRALDSVESYITEEPDRALSALDSLSQAGIKGKEANARYALLYSMALDKSYTDVTDDSLARIAVEYYRDRKDPGKKAQSWYYFGRVQQNAGDWIPATVSFTNAGKYADESGDCFLEGLVYRSMAEINSVTLNYPEELHYSSLAYEKFSAAGADKYRDYVLLYIAMAYNNSMDFANCESVCRTLRPIAEQYRDTALLAGCLLTYASALVFKESPEPEKAIEQITFVQDSLLVPLSLPDYGNLALAFQLSGQTETARSIVDQLKFVAGKDRVDRAKLSYIEYLMAERSGNYPEAFASLKTSARLQDSLFLQTMSQSVMGAQRDLLLAQSANDTERLRVRERTIMIMALASLMCILLTVMTYRNKIQTQNRELSQHMAQISSMSEELKSGNRNLMRQITDLYDMEFGFIDKICNEYYSSGHTPSGQKRVFNQITELVKDMSEDKKYSVLEHIVDRCRDGIMSKAREELVKFREEDFRFMCYFYAGFSYSTIALIFNIENINNVYVRKSRLKSRIEKLDVKDKTMFLDALA